jgi:hypothetical protein
LHTLLLPNLLLIGVSLCEVLGLVVSIRTSPSSLKTDFVMHLLLRFWVWRIYRFFLKGGSHLSLFDILTLTNSWALCGSLDRSFS